MSKAPILKVILLREVSRIVAKVNCWIYAPHRIGPKGRRSRGGKMIDKNKIMSALAFCALMAVAFVNRATAQEKPAEPIGASSCLGCHTSHESFKKNIHWKALANAKNIEFEKSCETCHGPGSLHAAAGGKTSDPGFATIKNPAKL